MLLDDLHRTWFVIDGDRLAEEAELAARGVIAPTGRAGRMVIDIGSGTAARLDDGGDTIVMEHATNVEDPTDVLVLTRDGGSAQAGWSDDLVASVDLDQAVARVDLDAVIGLGANLFYGTGIPACIIVIDKAGHVVAMSRGEVSQDFLLRAIDRAQAD